MSAKRILVIDDEPDIVDFLTTLFEDHGFETRFADNGTAGLVRAREQVPDLITLDITMPGRSGVSVFRELRRDPRLRAVPIIMITGVVELRQAMYRQSLAPPEAFLEKPVDPEGLIRQVRSILNLP
mgnify:CR=1 FL=1